MTEKRNAFEKRRLMLLSLCSTAAFSLLAHAYCYFAFSPSHDSLGEFCRSDNAFLIGLGRFMQIAYVAVRGKVCGPWICGALSILWTAVALYLLADLFRMQRTSTVVLLGALLSTAPATIYTNATYYQSIDIFMLAFMLSVLAVWLVDRYGFWSGKKRGGFLLGGLCVLCSLGLYQAFMASACGLVLMLFIFKALHDKCTVRQLAVYSCEGAGMLLVGGVGYKAALELILRTTGLSLEKAYNGLVGVGDYTGWSRLGLVCGAYRNAWDFFFNWEKTALPAAFAAGMAILLAADLAALAIAAHRSKAGAVAVLASGAALILLPFALNITYFISKGMMHELMQFPLILLPAFALVLLEWAWPQEAGKERPAIGKSLNIAAVVATGLIVLNNALFANNVYLEKRLIFQSTVSLVNRMIVEMESVDGYRVNETPVAFIGPLYNTVAQTERPELPGKAGVGLGDSYGITYYASWDVFFRYVMGYPIQIVEESEAYRAYPPSSLKDMPAFPQKGYCQMRDGVLVVKVSDD